MSKINKSNRALHKTKREIYYDALYKWKRSLEPLTPMQTGKCRTINTTIKHKRISKNTISTIENLLER